MKSLVKWGVARGHKVITCPECGARFVNRRKRRCLECNVALYAGSELLVDKKGYWWNAKTHKWISVKELLADKGDQNA